MNTAAAATDGEARPRLQVLSPAAIRRIHTATLDVIERVGVRFPSARAQAIWAANGATVDPVSGIVRVPGHIIEAALKTAPPAYVAGRPGPGLGPAARRPARPPGDRRLRHRGPGPVDAGRPPVDARGRGGHRARRRRPGRDRVPLGRRVRAGPPARDATRSRRSRAVFRNSTKHAQSESVVTAEEAATAIEMAAAIAGGPGRAPRAAGVLDDAVHDQPARPRRRVDRRGAGGRRGRDPGRVHDDGLVRLQRTRPRSRARWWSATPR